MSTPHTAWSGRRTVLVVALFAAVAAVVRLVRGAPAPAFAPSPPAGPGWVGPEMAAPDADPLSATPDPDPAAGAERSWVEPGDGDPPPSHPVKAKLASGIYHLPGMMNYNRTRADRYYRSATEAEADGLRSAKR